MEYKITYTETAKKRQAIWTKVKPAGRGDDDYTAWEKAKAFVKALNERAKKRREARRFKIDKLERVKMVKGAPCNTVLMLVPFVRKRRKANVH